MRLGFVGVGKHARRLAGAFSDCGATPVAYDRKNDSGGILDGFGRRMPWRDMVESPGIDAVVCCAPPDVTAEVVSVCAKTNTRCVATKPLICPQPSWAVGTSRVYVDLWRLYSPGWRALKSELRGRKISAVRIEFCGDGPVRKTHSGLLDYGPHALAFLLDLGLIPKLTWIIAEEDARYGLRRFWEATGHVGDCRVEIGTGNIGPPKMLVEVSIDGDTLRWVEDPPLDGFQSHHFAINKGTQLECQRDLALREFCRAFLAGEPSDTLWISCEATRILSSVEPR